MSFSNLGYNGNTPSNVSVQDNINQALRYQATHSIMETLEWFKSMVQNKGTWDYKQQSSDYENFGNFNYGAVGAALGYPDFVLQSAAGGAQFTSLYGIDIKFWAALDWVASWHPFVNSGSYDDPNDQAWINKGIDAAQVYGFDPYMQALESIDNAINGLFNAAIQAKYGSPLTLDLDGDGIETVGIDVNHLVLFDNNNDGIKTATGWVKSDDALLVLDRNANGTIDNGSELFGDNTLIYDSNNQPIEKAANGFDALAQYDTDNNGKIDETDSIYINLKIWQDYNQDGISQANELSSLNANAITSIGLSYENSSIISNNNLYALNGTYQKDNATQTITDVYFIQENFYREFTDTISLTEAASALPHAGKNTKQLQIYTEPPNNINLSQYMIMHLAKTAIIKNDFFMCLNNIWFKEAVSALPQMQGSSLVCVNNIDFKNIRSVG